MARPVRTRLLWLLLGILVVFGGCTGWLLRDPVPYFEQRRDATVSASVTVSDSTSGHVTERVSLRASNGLEGELMLRRPDHHDSLTRRPVFVILGGYRTGDRAATLIPDTHGNIVVALAYPWKGDTRVKGFSILPAVPSIRRAILDTPPAVMLALDWLLARPDVDSTRVELVGASFGAPFGTVVGALDRRVTRVWAVHAGAWPRTLIEHNLDRQIAFRPARATVAWLATLFASGWQMDPARWAPRVAPRPFIMINAREDERIPRAAIDALYTAAREPKEIIWLEGPHVQGNRPQVIVRLVETVLARATTP